MPPDALEQANPWWRDASARPTLPARLPGGLELVMRRAAVDVVHAAPRAGATTLLLRTIEAALNRRLTVAYVPEGASATWGTGSMLVGLEGEKFDLIAIDRPEGDDWPEQLKAGIDANLDLASTWFVVTTPGVGDAAQIAGRLAGRQGAGGRHLLLPRRFSDLLGHLHPKAHAHALDASQSTDADLVGFTRALQPHRRVLTETWRSYVESGALPSTFDVRDVTNSDAQFSAARALSPPGTATATAAALALGELNRDRSVSVMDLARAAGRSHGWARSLDARAENQLVWVKVPQLGKGHGAAAKRVLVDPAYAEVIESYRPVTSWEAVARSLWRSGAHGDPLKVRDHPVRWQKSTTDLLVIGSFILRFEADDAPDGRTLRGLAAIARGRRAIRVTDRAPDLRGEIPVLPAWAIALASDLRVVDWSAT